MLVDSEATVLSSKFSLREHSQSGVVSGYARVLQKQRELEKAGDEDSLDSNQLSSEWGNTELIARTVMPPLPLDYLLVVFEECSPHSSCIVAKATDALSQGWYFNNAKGEFQEEFTQNAAAELDALAADYFTFDDLCFQAAIDMMSIGWGIWEVVRKDPNDVHSDIVALYPLPAHTLRASVQKGIYAQSVEGQTRWFKEFGMADQIDAFDGTPLKGPAKRKQRAHEVIIFKEYNPRSKAYGGMAWISALPAIAELAAIREYNISWYGSGGTADRIVTATSKSGDVATKIITDLQMQLEEAKGLGHTTLFASGDDTTKVDVKSLGGGTVGRGDGNKDRQFSKGREDLIREVLMSHRTPPYRVGWAESGSLGGNAAKEMLRTYKSGGVRPVQKVLQARIGQTLFGANGLKKYRSMHWILKDFDMDTLTLDIEAAAKGMSFGMLTPLRAATLINQPVPEKDRDLPELNTYYILNNLVRVESVFNGSAEVKPSANGNLNNPTNDSNSAGENLSGA